MTRLYGPRFRKSRNGARKSRFFAFFFQKSEIAVWAKISKALFWPFFGHFSCFFDFFRKFRVFLEIFGIFWKFSEIFSRDPAGPWRRLAGPGATSANSAPHRRDLGDAWPDFCAPCPRPPSFFSENLRSLRLLSVGWSLGARAPPRPAAARVICRGYRQPPRVTRRIPESWKDYVADASLQESGDSALDSYPQRALKDKRHEVDRSVPHPTPPDRPAGPGCRLLAQVIPDF